MGRLYVRNFHDEAEEGDLRDYFYDWNDVITKVDIVTKKDENNEIISRFCYLTVSDDHALNQILKSTNGADWYGQKLEVKKAKESFFEKTAKLRNEAAKKTEKPVAEFKPTFQSKKFEESSSDESDSSESDEEVSTVVTKKVTNNATASERLSKQITSSKSNLVMVKEAENRRLKAANDRQKLFEQRKSAKPAGKKITFDDSDDESEKAPVKPKNLFDSDDDSDTGLDLQDKLRPEFEGQAGAELYQMEKGFGDNRFRVDDRFKDDFNVVEKVNFDNRKEQLLRRKREFQNVRHIPQDGQDTSDSEAESDHKDDFTNVKAPEIGKETFFKVNEIDIGATEEKPAEATGGFSLLNMFNRPVLPEEEKPAEDVEMEESDNIVKKPFFHPQVNTMQFGGDRKAGEKFNFFQTYDLEKFIVDKENVKKERAKLQAEATRDYQTMARKAKILRKSDNAPRIERILNWW